MAKFLVVLFALCVVPSIAAARLVAEPLQLEGRVYCDTCRCGYETFASTPHANALVRVECATRTNPSKLTYTHEARTDSNGNYKITVQPDLGDDLCDAKLVKSFDPECSTPNAGRDRARIVLTRNNGMASNVRFANALGFLKNTPLDSCTQILQQYQEVEVED